MTFSKEKKYELSGDKTIKNKFQIESNCTIKQIISQMNGWMNNGKH